jgi:hypothetical protein
VEVYYRRSSKQAGHKLWIGELKRNIQRLPQRLIFRLEACDRELECCVQAFPQPFTGWPIARRGGVSLPEGDEKARPVSADLSLKVGESATSCFGCFLEAASPDKSIGQLGKALADLLPIIEIDENFERLTEIGKCRIPSFKTSLGDRKARQQVSPFSCFNRTLMR